MGWRTLVLDLSYGGVKFETRRGDIPATFAITFGGFDVTIQARAVWSHPPVPIITETTSPLRLV